MMNASSVAPAPDKTRIIEPQVSHDVTVDDFPDPEEIPTGSMAGGFVIQRKLAGGGGGTVYQARHLLLGRVAAVKVLRREMAASAQMVTRFLREAQAVNLIKHPNIVDIFEFGQLPDQRPFYVMELLEGKTLRKLLQQSGRVSAHGALQLLEPVCDALEAAHNAGIVHRDLKASNIFVVSDEPPPVVKLLDFGIAKFMHPDPSAPGLTTMGTQLGSVDTMAPEQVRCEPVDARTDIYSLGVVLFQLITGEYPFRADTAMAVQRMHLDTPPPKPSQLVPVSAALDAVVIRCLQKSPDRRFPSIRAFREALREAVSSGSSGPQPTRALVRAIGIYLEARVDDAAVEDADDSLMDDVMAVVDDAAQTLPASGYALPIQTSNSVLGVRALASEETEASAVRQAFATATQLRTALLQRETRDPRVRIGVSVHVDDAVTRVSDDGVEVAGGNIMDISSWATQDNLEGVFMSDAAKVALS